MERRGFKRVHFNAQVFIQDGEDIIKGNAVNLGLGGLYLETDKKISENKIIDTIIIITSGGSHLSLKVKARVVWKDERGMALEFKDMDVDTLAHLSRYIYS